MAKINEKDLLDEIRFDIEKKDLIKAKLVLSALGQVGRNVQKQTLFEVSRADDDFAIPLLSGVIVEHPDVTERFPKLKETLFSKLIDTPDILLDLLAKTKETPMKIFLAEAAGDIRLKQAVPILLKILTEEKDVDIMESAISALGMIGDPSAVNLVGDYLYSKHRKIVVAAIQTLGVIATPSAIQKLAGRLGKDTALDKMIIDIVAKTQVPEVMEMLNQMLNSEHSRLRDAVKKKLGGIGAMSIRVLINNLFLDNPDLVIHSLNVLGDIGDPQAIPAIRKLIHQQPENPDIRFAAYETLGRLPLGRGVYTLAAGLDDPVDNVRNAAAKAIDRHYNAALAGGIRNLIRSGNSEALKIIASVIDSQCDTIFLDLFEEDPFRGPAVEYLIDKARPDVRYYFANLIEKTGHHDLAGKVMPQKPVKEKASLKVYAVDNSKMILNIYRTVLYNLGCESRLFEFPAKALEWIQKEKPDVVLTDLIMPDITGIDFTKGVRRWYSRSELPILMVTTQNESHAYKEAYSAGVNDIIHKPFTETQIGKALARFAGRQPPF